MSREITGRRDQMYVLPPSVEDWVPEDHPVRFVDEVVDSLGVESLDLSSGVSGVFGRPRYGSVLLLKLWLYAYVKGIRSSRKLEEACREQMPFIWLAGQEHPDHNTLWRFFRDNKRPIRMVSRRVSRLAANSGLIGLVLHAVDGTKIEARCSGRSGLHRDRLKRALAKVEQQLAEWMARIEASESEEDGDDADRLPPELRDAAARRARIQQGLLELDEAEVEHLHKDEPECQMMKCDGRSRFAYNAQAVVDQENGLIVAEDVTPAGSDNHQLVPMLDATRDVLGATADDTVADGGYASLETASALDSDAYEATFSVDANAGKRKQSEYHASRFRYDVKADCLHCPFGGILKPTGDWHPRRDRDYQVRRYRCQGYCDCERRWECSKDKKGRAVLVSEHSPALERMRERAESEEGKERLRQRKVIVEPVFGWIKEDMGFRRWTYRGLESVRAQWSLVCAALNVKRMAAHWQAGALVLGA